MITAKAVAENVAKNKGNADKCRVSLPSRTKGCGKVAVDGWIASDGHRKNLLGDFCCCGVGVFLSKDGTWFFTQLFST